MRNEDETAVATLLQYMRDQQNCTYILRRVGSNESKHLACKLFVWMRDYNKITTTTTSVTCTRS